MSSIMRARSGLTGRDEVPEVIGVLSRAEGCWTFHARDRMPRPSRATALYPVDDASSATDAPLPRERVRSLPLTRHSRRVSGPVGARDNRSFDQTPSLP